MLRKTAVLLLFLLIFSSCVAESAKGGQQLLDSIPSLTVYTSHNKEVYAPVIKEFQEKTGIWVTVVTGGSNKLLEQIASEADDPTCDVLFGGFSISHQAYSDYFEPFQTRESASILESCKTEDGFSTPFSTLPIVIVCNNKLVPASEMPRTWEDLLDSRWKGRIAFANPHVSVSSFVALTTMMQAVPGDPSQTLGLFAEHLAGRQMGGSIEIMEGISDGEYLAGIALEEAAIRRSRSGLNLSIIYPSGGTSIMTDATSLVKGAPNREMAQQFIDFTVSKDIQQLLVTDFCRRPVRDDVGMPEWIKPAHAIPAIEYDEAWVLENRNAFLEQWDGYFEG